MTDKKEYITPEFEVITFDSEDVIRTSTQSTGQTGGIYELPRVGGTAKYY